MNKKSLVYILSSVIILEAILFALCGFIGLIYKESEMLVYFSCSIIFGVIGLIATRVNLKEASFFAKDGFLLVALSWVVLSIIGALPLYFTHEIPSFIDALFEIISGFTTTGSSILNDVEALSHASLFWRSLTHFVGGMGVLVFVLALLPKVSGSGMYIMKAESPGPTVGKFVSKLSDTARILYLIYTGMTILEFIILVIFGLNAFDAINIAFETAGTGGFSIYNNSLTNMTDAVKWTVSIFMILFGINFNVYYLFLIKKAKDAFRCEEMRAYLLIVFVSTCLIAINIANMYDSISETILMSFFHVSSIITTTGFGAADFNLWPTFSKTILIILMIIGACAGSTGGGMKVSRIVILIKDAFNSLKNLVHPHEVRLVRFEDKIVEKDVIDSIKSYLGLYCLIFVISLILIAVDNFDFTTNFSAVCATLNNIGPGLNQVGPCANFSIYSNFSKLILMFDMLAGRLELIPMIMIFMPNIYTKNK